MQHHKSRRRAQKSRAKLIYKPYHGVLSEVVAAEQSAYISGKHINERDHRKARRSDRGYEERRYQSADRAPFFTFGHGNRNDRRQHHIGHRAERAQARKDRGLKKGEKYHQCGADARLYKRFAFEQDV